MKMLLTYDKCQCLILYICLYLLSSMVVCTAAAACNPNLAPYGLIGQRYADLIAAGKKLGCAVEAEKNAEGRGRVQYFEFGSIAWSPDTGTSSLLAAWLEDDHIAVQWGDTAPYSYDKFIVHWNGSAMYDQKDQDNVNGSHIHSGSYNIPIMGNSIYRIVVEGCDVNTFTGSTCKQGWSNPLYIKPNMQIFCDGYAKDALNQINKSSANHCVALSGPRWVHDYNAHYGWCLSQPIHIVNSERQTRAAEAGESCGPVFNKCAGPNPPSDCSTQWPPPNSNPPQPVPLHKPIPMLKEPAIHR